MTASVTNPFPLGAYLGNPDNSIVSNEALFESNVSCFAAVTGIAPQYFDSFVDQQQPVSSWVGNSNWAASSAAASRDAQGMTPVIAVPLSSRASGSLSSDQSFKAFGSGQNDSVLQGIVKAWASEGFSKLVFRPGWEMNLPGPTYAGADSLSQSDWVAAFQHVYTVLHQAAAADGVSVQVVWNPGTINYAAASATGSLYPGDAYADAIGADVYSDIYPYSDGTTPATYHDWNTGLADTSVAQFIADPVNRKHYWTYPAATKWQSDSSLGHSLSLENLIQFTAAHGKPFAIPETGAGNSNAGTDVSDDAAFPAWLAGELANAQAAGQTISFVNLWDSDGGGNYEFSHASDGKPAEAAAWGSAFGAFAPTVMVGSGRSKIVLDVSEDAYRGDAQFTVSVDGAQAGGTLTATLSHAAGQTQAFVVEGAFAAGPHRVTVRFLNDAYGGHGLDRNLYVDDVSYAGATTHLGAALYSAGPRTFAVIGRGQAPDTLILTASEDAYKGDAQLGISIDGQSLSAAQTVTARHGSATQTLTFTGAFGPGAHSVAVTFLNDAYGGSASLDRNLYVDGLTLNGVAATPATAAVFSSGAKVFAIPAAFPAVHAADVAGSFKAVSGANPDLLPGAAQPAATAPASQAGAVSDLSGAVSVPMMAPSGHAAVSGIQETQPSVTAVLRYGY